MKAEGKRERDVGQTEEWLSRHSEVEMKAWRRLPERWYLAALWPQWERQLGRERRLRASTDRAAITAPITLRLNQHNNNNKSSALGHQPRSWSRTNSSSRESRLWKKHSLTCSEVWISQTDKGNKMRKRWQVPLACLCVCAHVTWRPHSRICLSLRRGVTATESEMKKRTGSNGAAELLTFHITGIARLHVSLFLSRSLPPLWSPPLRRSATQPRTHGLALTLSVVQFATVKGTVTMLGGDKPQTSAWWSPV